MITVKSSMIHEESLENIKKSASIHIINSYIHENVHMNNVHIEDCIILSDAEVYNSRLKDCLVYPNVSIQQISFCGCIIFANKYSPLGQIYIYISIDH